jgi:hypothetical protein
MPLHRGRRSLYRPPIGASDEVTEAGKQRARSAVIGRVSSIHLYKGEIVNTLRLTLPD